MEHCGRKLQVMVMLRDRCPVCLSVCNVGVLWPNGWMDQDTTYYGGRPRPGRHCGKWLEPHPSHPRKWAQHPPLFGSCHAKRSPILATAELMNQQELSSCWDGRPCHNKVGQKVTGCYVPLSVGGQLGPHLKQCRLGRGLPLYQVAYWSIQPYGHNTPTLQTDRQDIQQFRSIGRTATCNGRLMTLHRSIWIYAA